MSAEQSPTLIAVAALHHVTAGELRYLRQLLFPIGAERRGHHFAAFVAAQTAIDAVLTGYFGSLSLYETPTAAQREHADHLLTKVDDAAYAGAMAHEADVLVRQRAEGKTPAQRVADYLALLGMENSDRVRMAIASLLPPGVTDAAVAATVRQMRRRWLELYGDDPFFAED